MTKQSEIITVSDAGEQTPANEHRAHVVNPKTLLESLEKISHRAQNNSGSVFPATCGWIVLDQVSTLRKQLGFSGLETLMRAIHTRLRDSLSPGDLTARFGIDSIGLILESLAGERSFDKELNHLVEQINGELFELEHGSVSATISAALLIIDEELNPAEQNLVKVATEAEALRSGGGNRGQIVKPADSDSRQHSSSMLGRLTKALRDNNLKFLYQPLLSTAGCNRERFQLLPRLIDEDGKLIPAADFIPVAAKRGVLPAVDSWMIRQAIDLLKGHQDAGSESPTFFLNQSPAMIDDPKLLDWLLKEIQALDQDRRLLVLEFSINDMKSRIREAQPVLTKLRKEGLSISMTGIDEQVPEQVVLEHLATDYLRMKADFARRMLISEQLNQRFSKFAKMAHAASRKLIVPMLEDAESVARIWQMEVDFIQGNFIQQPSEQPQS